MKLVGLAVFGVSIVAAPPAHAQCGVVTQYSITQLPDSSPLDLQATGLNSVGQASGHYLDPSTLTDRAIRWDSPSQYVVLGGTSRAYGIGNNGSVAGQTDTGQGTRAARWSSSNVLTVLAPIKQGTASSAHGVNQSNLTVGDSTKSGNLVATSWAPSTATNLTSHMSPAPASSSAWAVNDSGLIAGYANYADGTRRAVTWTGTTATLLVTLGSNNDSAFAVSSDGRVAGAGVLTSIQHAALWQSGQVIDLGSYQSHPTQGNGVNSCGTVVGDALVSDEYSNIHVALIWQNGGALTDLNTLLPVNSGWTLLVAAGINNNGQIVGHGLFNGHQHAFLLTPAS